MIKRIISILIIFMLMFAAIPAAFGEGEEIIIDSVRTSDEYKGLLMDSLDMTVLGTNTNIREQIRKILYLDDITVDSVSYNRIIKAVQSAITTQSLSENASLDSYTPEDLAVAVDLISEVCDALELDFSIDPSNDSQNEYARVITISKNGKTLGKINADAKTDVGSPVSAVWIVLGTLMIISAAAVGIWQLMKRKTTEI